MAVWFLVLAFIIGAGDGSIWPSLLALAYILYYFRECEDEN